MQKKLEEAEAANCRKIAAKLGSAFDFDATDEGKGYWQGVVESLCKKWKHGTSDGKPWVEPEPPLTDRDACVWPRLLVMVRDNDTEQWEGPFRYVGRYDDDKPFPFIVYRKDGLSSVWKHARRATPAEIEAAK